MDKKVIELIAALVYEVRILNHHRGDAGKAMDDRLYEIEKQFYEFYELSEPAKKTPKRKPQAGK